MRRLALLSFLLPVLASGQADDPRLAAKVTLRYRYVSLEDLGKYVAQATNLKVTVDRKIADRKATIFCKDQPLGTVLAKVGETLFLQWEKDGDGYRLRLDPEVEKEERLIEAKETDLVRNALRDYFADAADLAKDSPEEIAQEAEKLKRRVDELGKDGSAASREERQKTLLRYNRLARVAQDRSTWDRGYIARQISPTHIESLLNGETIFAFCKPRPGALRGPADAPAHVTSVSVGEGQPPFQDMMWMIRFDPEDGMLRFPHRPLGLVDRAVAVLAAQDLGNSPAVLGGLSETGLVKRLLAWEKVKDPAVMSAPLSQEAKLPDGGSPRVWTLADNLQWLHDKTGLPIVADGFRVFASLDRPADGKTVAEWLANFNQMKIAEGQWRWPPARVRSEGGWLEMRHRRYWRMVRREIPERILLPMESKANLTLDDYANFAATLSPAQEGALRGKDVIVRFSLLPLERNVSVLKLWRSLSSGNRSLASGQGLPYATMPADSGSLYARALWEQLWDGLIDEKVLPHFLPGGPPLPDGMALFVREPAKIHHQMMGPNNSMWQREDELPNTEWVPYDGFLFVLGASEDSHVRASVMLKPQPKK